MENDVKMTLDALESTVYDSENKNDIFYFEEIKNDQVALKQQGSDCGGGISISRF